MANEKLLIDFETARKNVMNILAGKVSTPVAVKVAVAMQEATVDAVEVEDPDLLKAIELLIKQYDHSKASEYVHNPVAHALYHTWKQVDERR